MIFVGIRLLLLLIFLMVLTMDDQVNNIILAPTIINHTFDFSGLLVINVNCYFLELNSHHLLPSTTTYSPKRYRLFNSKTKTITTPAITILHNMIPIIQFMMMMSKFIVMLVCILIDNHEPETVL